MFISRAKVEYEWRIYCPVAEYPCKRWSFKDLGLIDVNMPGIVSGAFQAVMRWLILEDKNHSEHGIGIIPYRIYTTFKGMVDIFLHLLLEITPGLSWASLSISAVGLGLSHLRSSWCWLRGGGSTEGISSNSVSLSSPKCFYQLHSDTALVK